MNFFFLAALALLVLFGIYALYGGHELKTEPAAPAEVRGKFTLFLYGCSSADDIENVVILDREEDAYAFEIMAPDFSYTIRKGLTAEEALREAEQFVRCNINVQRTRLHRIMGPTDAVVGFEVMPLYPVIQFGREDVIDVRYTLRDRKIAVRVRIDQSIERARTN